MVDCSMVHQKSFRVICMTSVESLCSVRSPDQLSEDLIGGACGGIVVVKFSIRAKRWVRDLAQPYKANDQRRC